jgi:ubiquinone/menaquinone biosynthesis C-methylase UbiE
MFSDPETVVPYFGLTDGNIVADFGVGSGHYSIAMSKRVGNNGRIYAIDIQKDLLSRLEAEAKQVGARNIHIAWGDVEKSGGTKLADGSVDFVLLANTLFQSTARYSIALEARRILRLGGQVAVIDWADSFNNLGPIAEHIATPDEVKVIFAQAGFVFDKDFPAGEHHYGLLFRKRDKVQ